MGGSSQPSNTTSVTTVRFAPYIEEKHEDFLATVFLKGDEVVDDSPFEEYVDIDVDPAFFGIGYVISQYTALYDAYGKYMAGMDIEVKWTRAFTSVHEADEARQPTIEELDAVADSILKKELPDFLLLMRENNCVQTSTFTIGKSLMEDKRIKLVEDFSLKRRVKLMPSVNVHYRADLDWFRKLTTLYAELMKVYYISKTEMVDTNDLYRVRNTLWAFEIFDFEGTALGALRGAATYIKRGPMRQRSTISKVLSVASYAATGATYGSVIGGIPGTVIGAVVGTVVGIGMLFL